MLTNTSQLTNSNDSISQTKPSTSTNPTDYVNKRANQSEEWGCRSFVSNYIYSNNLTLSECKKKHDHFVFVKAMYPKKVRVIEQFRTKYY